MKENIFNSIKIDDIATLADRIGTPFYLIFENKIRKNYNSMVNSLVGLDNIGIYYSIKTNYEVEVLRTIKDLGMGVDVSCQFDLYLAKKYGFDYSKMVIDNSYNIREGLKDAISNDVHMINVETWDEAERINALGKQVNRIVNIGIRVSIPLIHRDIIRKWLERHQKKFGIILEEVTGVFAEKITSLKYVKLKGLFVHSGLPYPVPGDYLVTLKKLFRLAYQFKKYKIEIVELNIGGGFPNPEVKCFNEIPILLRKALLADRLKRQIETNFFKKISKCFLEQSKMYDLKPALSLEPGNFIADNAAVMVGRIVRKYKKQVEVDISENDLGFKFPFKDRTFIIANKTGEKLKNRVNIVGPTCNSFDVLFKNVYTPDIQIGDIVIIFNVGGYCIARSIQHIRPRRPVYFMDSLGKVDMIRREEKYEDILNTQIYKNC